MKKSVLVVLLVGIFMIGLVSAAYDDIALEGSCVDNDREWITDCDVCSHDSICNPAFALGDLTYYWWTQSTLQFELDAVPTDDNSEIKYKGGQWCVCNLNGDKILTIAKTYVNYELGFWPLETRTESIPSASFQRGTNSMSCSCRGLPGAKYLTGKLSDFRISNAKPSITPASAPVVWVTETTDSSINWTWWTTLPSAEIDVWWWNVYAGDSCEEPSLEGSFSGGDINTTYNYSSLGEGQTYSINVGYRNTAGTVSDFVCKSATTTVPLALTCSDPNQTIMKLDQPSNSYGALWNDPFYGIDICYDDIFGTPYEVVAGVDPHDCDAFGNNRVVSLSAPTNAHASNISSDANYPIDVCYGDLQCTYTTGTCDGEVIARMYSGTNTYLSNASDTTYPIKICCEPALVAAPVLKWYDITLGEIVKGGDNMPSVGDTVYLVAQNSPVGDFNIIEYDLVIDNDIITIPGQSYWGTLFFTSWKITGDDLDKAGNLEDFYFTTTTTGGTESNKIDISKVPRDSPTKITIETPACGEDFDDDEDVTIRVIATDLDDVITGNVTVDGVTFAITNGVAEFEHRFSGPGNYQIYAEGMNGRDGQYARTARAYSNIMILETDGAGYAADKTYVAACILQPEDASYIEDTNRVPFDASTTTGVSVDSSGNMEVVHASDDPERFSFFWMFHPDGGTRIRDRVDNPTGYAFNRTFPRSGGNSANLKVEFF